MRRQFRICDPAMAEFVVAGISRRSWSDIHAKYLFGAVHWRSEAHCCAWQTSPRRESRSRDDRGTREPMAPADQHAVRVETGGHAAEETKLMHVVPNAFLTGRDD